MTMLAVRCPIGIHVHSRQGKGDKVLARDKLNIAGETHTESDARRALERQFCSAKTGSADYWTENDFPDLPLGGQQQAHAEPGADLMEYRATHGAAMLIVKFDKLGDEAINVSATPVNSAATAIGAFNTEVQELMQFRDRVDRSWRPSSDAVNRAVQAVYDNVESAYQAYDAALRNAPAQQQLKAVRDFANSRIGLRDLVPALADAAGARLADKRDAAELAKFMRRQRSTFMGLGAVFSKRKAGVWKVGDGHIQDLTDGTSKIDRSRINIITKKEFNEELAAWRGGQTT
ncbi:hypothetical protein NE236_26290 [Actinoallomurus purpureus]|uniref:hypothetical protein n=1 Tax=Actinoallomurus purpureus TaxID=478114 RepID=UPI00209328F3|nr:hypothetical protein [Actinoallomurus purpureus]MCO6008491.1 hypothetical protein [Actinoallomurus purpureus]